VIDRVPVSRQPPGDAVTTTETPRTETPRTETPGTEKSAGGFARLAEFGRDGFAQCWYPIALSSDVAPGQVVGADFLDGRVACFRGENGEVSVVSAYCRHLGTDLSRGTVVGDNLRCDFHFWCYGRDGRCTDIPVADRIPEDSSLFAYPSAESVGLIWAFNGTDPLYDVPQFPLGERGDLALRIGDLGVLPFPTFMGTANSMDAQHLEVVHGVPNELDFDTIDVGETHIEYDMIWHEPNFGRVEQHIKDFGINVVTVTGELAGVRVGMLFAGRPIKGDNPGGHTHGYNVVSVPNAQVQGVDDDAVEQQLDMAYAYARGLIADDERVMDGMHFRVDRLVPADRMLSRYFRYVDNYPRAHPGAARIV
jgi:nitrite reductase/ring-hydroxylating ferredoxin subunit